MSIYIQLINTDTCNNAIADSLIIGACFFNEEVDNWYLHISQNKQFNADYNLSARVLFLGK